MLGRSQNDGFVLDWVKEERPEALGVCIAEAWKKALVHLDGSKLPQPSHNESAEMDQEVSQAARTLSPIEMTGTGDI